MFPIPGTKRLKYLEENAAAFFVELTPEDKRFLEDTFHQDNVSAAVLFMVAEASGTRLAIPPLRACCSLVRLMNRSLNARMLLEWQLNVAHSLTSAG